ncbi:hypothetical protein DL765_003819 [Monosporascus sp. GIB2]|nr:hypothetical protein DL765_003819 [Monosporascus sp. GIB2]
MPTYHILPVDELPRAADDSEIDKTTETSNEDLTKLNIKGASKLEVFRLAWIPSYNDIADRAAQAAQHHIKAWAKGAKFKLGAHAYRLTYGYVATAKDMLNIYYPIAPTAPTVQVDVHQGNPDKVEHIDWTGRNVVALEEGMCIGTLKGRIEFILIRVCLEKESEEAPKETSKEAPEEASEDG